MAVTDWFISIAASSAGGAALLALAGYLCRTQLAHWLNKDLEAVKAQHQRELESYKVSLIADAERAKAMSEVRKTMAIRIVEKKFEAIDSLHRGLSAKANLITSTISVYRGSNAELRSAKVIELADVLHKVYQDQSVADTFLAPQESVSISDFLSSLASLMGQFGLPDFEMSDDEFQTVSQTLYQKQAICDGIVNAHISKMMDVDGIAQA